MLTGTIANANSTTTVDSADFTATVTISGLSVLGVPVNLTGALTYDGTNVSFSLTGTLGSAATLTTGVVLDSGATFTLDSGSGLSVNGTVDLGSGATVVPVSVAGTLAGISDWSLTVSDPNASPWQPEPGLTVTPDFTGTLKDTDGGITFDLSTDNTVAWQPAPNVELDVTNLEVSNEAPPSTVSCPSGLEEGALWVDAEGIAKYTQPDATSPLVSLTGQACLAPSQESFTLTTDATGNLAPPLGSSFTLTDLALDVNGNFATDDFSVEGSASLGGVGSAPALTAGVAFDTDGSFQAGVALADLSTLGISGLSGSGAVWVSTEDIPSFVPSSIPGFTSDTPFHLRKGLDATLTYSLPSTEQSDLTSWGIPVPQSVTAVASISGAGVTLNLDLDFGAGENGATILNTGGAAVYLNQVTLGVVLGSEPELTIGGTATLHLPSVTGNSNSTPSDVSVTLTAAFELDSASITVGIALTGECNDAPCPWQDAFGIQGLTIGTFAASIGVELGDGIPLPTLSFDLDNVMLPTEIAQPIGLQPDAEISIDVNFDLDAPIVHFGLTAPAGQAALYPLQITGNSSLEDAIAIDTADFWLAPVGGVLADQQVVTPGASIQFKAIFGGVSVNVYAAVNLSSFSVDASITISNFWLGPVQFSAGPGQPAVVFKLHLGTDGFTFEFEGGFSFTGFDFSASINLSAVSSFVGASASVSITAGLPQYLQLGANLKGSFSLDSSGLNLSASGSGFLIVAGDNLGSVNFGFSFNSGVLWGAITQAYQQVAQAFQNAYNWTANQITQALAGLQYDATEVASALNYIGVQAAQIGQDIVQFFSGTSDGSLASYLDQAGLSPEQIGSALKSAFADVDSTVAYWLNQLGYTADQIGQTLQSVFNDVGTQVAYVFDEIGMTASQITQVLSNVFSYAQYQILNALGDLGITGQTVLNALTSFFTGDGSYWIGTSDALVLDVNGASTAWGAEVDQWYWNGGYNQDWFVIPTDSGYAEIVNRNSGQCLSVSGDSYNPGTPLVQWPCTGDYSQQWFIGGGTYPGWSEEGWNAGIGNRLTGLYADVYGASPWAGDEIDQWYWNGGWNQYWQFTQAVG